MELRRRCSGQFQRHVAKSRVLAVGRNDKTQLPAHCQHRCVFGEDIAGDGLEALFVDRVRVDAHHADEIAGRLVERDEGHGPRVVELGQPGNEPWENSFIGAKNRTRKSSTVACHRNSWISDSSSGRIGRTNTRQPSLTSISAQP
jgi:hypothetical protein